ncbi:MAG: hypothetical protein EXS25_08005 [Pedosphaera sp.]|nr:hypothetical protein [Pedosphaera sp.]
MKTLNSALAVAPNLIILEAKINCNLMKTLAAVLSALLLSLAVNAKDVTLTGEGKCLKCALKKADKCQNVLEVKKGDKTTLYKLVGDTSKKFHAEICSEAKKVSVSGSLTKTGDDNEIEVTKIEVVK